MEGKKRKKKHIKTNQNNRENKKTKTKKTKKQRAFYNNHACTHTSAHNTFMHKSA